MKTNYIFKLAVIIFIPVLFYSILSGFKNKENKLMIAQDTVSKGFVNAIWTDAFIPQEPGKFLNRFLPEIRNDLNFNLTHVYSWNQNDSFGYFGQLLNTQQIANVNSLLNDVENNGLKILLGRINFEYMAYAQRLRYETEGGNDGFSYQYRTGMIKQDSGRTVITTEDPNNTFGTQPRWLLKNVYENLQHGDLLDFNQLDLGIWSIKPNMRIRTGLDPETKVVRINVVAFNGDTVKKIDIKVRNFGSGYYGNYIEKYSFVVDSLLIPGDSSRTGIGLNKGITGIDFNQWDTACHVDFQIWWYGETDVWIDKVTLDDEKATKLFDPDTLLNYDKYIIQEIQNFASHNATFSLNIDEVVYSSLESIRYLKNLIEQNVPAEHQRIHFATTNYLNARSLKNNSLSHSALLREIQATSFSNDAHEIPIQLPNTLNLNNLPLYYPQTAIVSPVVYNNILQERFGDKNESGSGQGSFVYQVELSKNLKEQYSPESQFIMQPQLHAYMLLYDNIISGTPELGGLREPTNQEIEAQAMLSIAHGAEGLCWFVFQSDEEFPLQIQNRYFPNPTNGLVNGRLWAYFGLINPKVNNSYVPRTSNWYSQNKWQYVGNMNIKIEHWKPTLDLIEWGSGYSVHSEGAGHNFISDIKSIKRNETLGYTDASPCTSCDETNERYWEMGFFNPDFNNPEVSANDKSKHFIMVNRRCVLDSSSTGDFRQLRIKFNSSELSEFKNWKIIDLDSNKVIRTFDKDSNIYVDMKEFLPGEGKLYKLAPVMQEGGTLVANEECVGEFDCKGEVNNNGYNITLKPATTIHFTNTNARIKMSGGNFRSGVTPTESTAPVFLKGKNGNFWKGLLLNECGEVEIMTTYFENVSPYPVDSTYALQLINCEYINISYSRFLAEPDIKTGGILINYTSDLRAKEVYVNYNQFEMDAGEMPALSVITSGYITFPIIIEGNKFESFTGNSSNAILLSGVVGGAVKENQIIGYKNGIIMIWSSMDLYENFINGGDDDSKGILSYAYTFGNLAPVGGTYTGGLNTIRCEGENATCVDLNNSFTYLQDGYNKFDLTNYEPGNAFHLTGTIPDEVYEIYGGEVDATNNCFRVSGNDTDAVHNLIYMNEDPVDVDFIPYHCEPAEQEGLIVFDLGNGMSDTIYTESEGSGGGMSNYELRIKNYELKNVKSINENQSVEVISIKGLEDSVSINLRKRDYVRVSEFCYELLTDHIDSLKEAGAITKLYLAELRLDSSGNRISNLKSFLEALILNNPEKESFVKQAFYIIQKCKASLGQYQSAMTGFQQIINNNPYSYEGLLASWDYAATSLLNSTGGGGGVKDLGIGMSDLEIKSDLQSQIQNPKSQIENDDPKDKYDKKAFTKEDRKIIRQNVVQSFETSREKEVRKIKELETKVGDGTATRNEKSDLQMKKVLSEIVKVKIPKDISEHISIVNNDVQKVFGSTVDNSAKEIINLIPTEYSLSQNYPNPFNPTTKIRFDLPADSKVKLMVYDILGREIKSIVNGELSMGRYEYEFNGSNFASGVYFYRLETDNFVQTKRMVLLK